MKEPDKVTISKVMAALGRRNKGKRKAMTRREVKQRRDAARRSAEARRHSSGVLTHPKPGAKSVPVKHNGCLVLTPTRHLTL